MLTFKKALLPTYIFVIYTRIYNSFPVRPRIGFESESISCTTFVTIEVK